MKNWYASKTLWLNLVAIVVLVAQSQFGYLISPEIQAAILALINMVLRMITHQAIDWTAPETPNVGGPGIGENGSINLRCLVELFLVGFATLLVLAACASPGAISGPNAPPAPIVAAQEYTQKTLQAQGALLQAVPATLEALYTTQQISNADYNKAVPLYNQAIASYQLAVAALDASIKAGRDPSTDSSVGTPYGDFLRNRDLINNFLIAFGQPAIDGTGGKK